MNEHTPGPWTFENDSITAKAGGIRSTRDRLLVVGISTPMSSGPAMEEGRANARLIAAAPDLLAALRGLFEGGFIEAGTQPSGEWHDGARMQGPWEAELETRLVPCREAIDKAMGFGS